MSEQRELSLRLNAVLEMVGASEQMRKVHQRTASIMEIIADFHTNRATRRRYRNVHICGSFYEGTVTPDLASDVDIIWCRTKPLVVPHRSMAGPGSFLTMVREDWTRPGYVKLQEMVNGRLLTVYDVEECEIVGFDRAGRACEKHWIIGKMHGPAAMFVDEQGRHIQDNVFAFQCKGIPLFATDWITRHRRYGWPSQQLIDELKMMGCLFVPVGHFESPDKDLEWRVSFSLQERRLMNSLNLTQHRVYILLKMVKKNVLETSLQEESLSSYHCKTCLFYMIEATATDMWVPGNLITCLLQCLKLLLQWIKDRCCPSFFLKDSNLFDKEGLSRHMGTLERLLGLILQTDHMFLYFLKSDRVGEILLHGGLCLYRPISNKRICEYVRDIKTQIIGQISTVGRALPEASDGTQDFLSFYMATLEKWEGGDGVPGYTQEESQRALRYTLPWLHLSIGLEFAARAVTCPDRHGAKELIKKVECHLQQARNTDLVNVRLAQVTILLRLEKLEECFLMLQELENCWTFRVANLCPCTERALLSLPNDEHQQRELLSIWKEKSIRNLARTHVSSCVIFERSQMELVPLPLRCEMYRSLYTQPDSRDQDDDAWFDQAEVDAKVYLYLLQYLVCAKLNREPHKQIAIDNLAALTQHGRRGELWHTEKACNLLGWVYLQEDRVADAMRCFQKSWEIRPDHNAAKFHVLQVLLRHAERQTRQ